MQGASAIVLAGLSLFLGATHADACQVPPHRVTKMPETVRLVAGTRSGAWFDGPTTIYPHGVLGDDTEALVLAAYSPFSRSSCGDIRADAGLDHVFEDVAPRLADLDGDALPEIIVVRTHLRKGAQLAIYKDTRDGKLTLIAKTPYIGKRNRWLAPIGAADLDGDGEMEVAYIDRPHLAKTLRVWRYARGNLTEIAELPGLTNHRIGERDIAGGIRTCEGLPEMIVASADWTELRSARLSDGKLASRPLGPHEGRASFARAMTCP